MRAAREVSHVTYFPFECRRGNRNHRPQPGDLMLFQIQPNLELPKRLVLVDERAHVLLNERRIVYVFDLAQIQPWKQTFKRLRRRAK
jgi:hypothetical protein